MAQRALVVGATGIVGQNLARRLVAEGWTVYGLSRRTMPEGSGIIPVQADALDASGLAQALRSLTPTHVFFCTWTRCATEHENCVANAAMLRNVFEALPNPGALQHAALVTGLKHYLGPFEAYAKGVVPETPFREDMPRLSVENFYYAQEDVLYEAAQKHAFTWSVHRPHTVVGYAIGNVMNIASTLAVYATLCRETGRPFVFPGSAVQWHGLTDLTDARQLAAQLVWAATSASGENQAFNVVNGDVVRWKWLWPRLAAWFGLEAAPYPDQAEPLEPKLAQDIGVWADIAARHVLREPDLNRLASAWHTDADLGRPIECVTDMTKSRLAGFTAYQDSTVSFLDVFERLRAEQFIP
ncbi:NAD dependent epimerase/dehydratase [Acetobacter cibinongensis]|uniref:NAD dependent epimerase/dehydratase n=1 Tax=Acetobacter cibinongensis TaxID=146475 RepID=A0A0D6MZY1_9PROT|nr:SDR family oxidoreductase [Acetobacter cibinongensis]GAN59297.1 oxidoreductase [Acetobacter cibinongensis]GEL59046.1 NAD dependent epimerase/dehydratase [Acetobacter cibinongensis]